MPSDGKYLINRVSFLTVRCHLFYLQAEKVHEFAEQIGKKLAEAEKLGNEGFVEESMKKMAEVEELKKEKVAAEVN